jgi:hypothetical protein
VSPPEPVETTLDADQTLRLRRFRYGVTAAMIVLCNAVFLTGMRWSGVNVDTLIRVPDQFDPTKDICLRTGWHRVDGSRESVKLCNEWINVSDPSGRTHHFQPDTAVVQAADGRLYFKHADYVDYRLFVLGLFVALITVFGILITRLLVARYRLRLLAHGHVRPV